MFFSHIDKNSEIGYNKRIKNKRKTEMLQNLHTHTTFCHGNDTPEELVLEAIKQGFDSIGMSSHASSSHTDLGSNPSEYIREVLRVKEKYKNKIRVFLGIELDYYSVGYVDPTPYEYRIGSVHSSVLDGGIIVPFDYDYESSKYALDTVFGGDGIKYAAEYYKRVAEMPFVFDYEIVGHFDLVSKFGEKYPPIFDEESSAYRDLALEALHAVRERREIFEVNTGAMGRKIRTSPYPAVFILKEMKKLKCKLILSSDCHDKNCLTTGFAEARELVRSVGFDEIYYLGENGFFGEKI